MRFDTGAKGKPLERSPDFAWAPPRSSRRRTSAPGIAQVLNLPPADARAGMDRSCAASRQNLAQRRRRRYPQSGRFWRRPRGVGVVVCRVQAYHIDRTVRRAMDDKLAAELDAKADDLEGKPPHVA